MTETEQSMLTEDWIQAAVAQELTALMGYVKPPKGAHYDCKLASNEDFSPWETKIVHVMTNLQVYGCQAMFSQAVVHAQGYHQGSLFSRCIPKLPPPPEPSRWPSRI